jgi:hypothetical protein
MGNVTQNVLVDGSPIGTNTIPNLILKPGDNYFPMQGAYGLTKLLGQLSSKYKDGKARVTISGNSSTYDNQRLRYFDDGLRKMEINTTLDLGPALEAIGINWSALTSTR